MMYSARARFLLASLQSLLSTFACPGSIVSNINEGPRSTALAVQSATDVSTERLLALLILAGGFIARCVEARAYFLNPDEALHNLLASHNSFALTWAAALTQAHPPLFIIVLHYWRYLFSAVPGQSEFMLRMPSLLAGTASCWLTYLWLKRITSGSTALIGLILTAFSPTLIGLSAEIRQYALLMFFVSACLYLSENALEQNSHRLMILYSLSLCGALLTHYSALLFALSMGVYLLARLYPWGRHAGLVVTWATGQVVALGLIVYFLLTHVPRLRQMEMPQGIAETWLRKSIYHRGEDNLLLFPLQQTLRIFTYLFSHGFLGTVALLIFLAGIIWLLKQKSQKQLHPSAHELALLIGLPFVTNCAVAIAGLYPYGGTRHDVYLSSFALAGTAIGVSLWKPKRVWIRTVIILLGLAFCNFFPAPPPMIRARNHKRELMNDAVAFLRQGAPAGSILFADYQSGLLLSYYVCGHVVVEEFPPLEPYMQSACGPYGVITTRPDVWKFYSDDFPGRFASGTRTYGIPPGTKVWLFDAGWITDSAPALAKELHDLGCREPKAFGENILVCELIVPGS